MLDNLNYIKFMLHSFIQKYMEKSKYSIDTVFHIRVKDSIARDDHYQRELSVLDDFHALDIPSNIYLDFYYSNE